jgi:hypothetical protein
MKTVFGLAAALGTVAAQYEAGNASLPTVDLGYEIYQASGYNVSLVSCLLRDQFGGV